MVRVETVIYKGIKFRRYPDSERIGDRMYFRPGIADRQRGVDSLHREIWRDNFGPIPPGHDVHHVDRDSLNNDPSNLACLSKAVHAALHAAERGLTEANIRLLQKLRPKATGWHQSPEGREWHRAHGRRSWEGRESRSRQCECCGATYATTASHGKERFCSSTCRAKWRRDARVDVTERQCAWCAGPFRTNRYSRQRFCGRSCSSKHTRSVVNAARKGG